VPGGGIPFGDAAPVLSAASSMSYSGSLIELSKASMSVSHVSRGSLRNHSWIMFIRWSPFFNRVQVEDGFVCFPGQRWWMAMTGILKNGLPARTIIALMPMAI
jgi:hypothetical protein